MGVGLSASFLHCEKKERSRQIWGCYCVFLWWVLLFRCCVGLVCSISLLHLERQELGGFGVVIEFGIFSGWLALLRNFGESFLCRELSEWVVRVPRTGVGGKLHLSVRLLLLLLLIRGVDCISIRLTKKVRPMRPNNRIRSSILLLPKTMVHKIMVLVPRTLISEGD